MGTKKKCWLCEKFTKKPQIIFLIFHGEKNFCPKCYREFMENRVHRCKRVIQSDLLIQKFSTGWFRSWRRTTQQPSDPSYCMIDYCAFCGKKLDEQSTKDAVGTMRLSKKKEPHEFESKIEVQDKAMCNICTRVTFKKKDHSDESFPETDCPLLMLLEEHRQKESEWTVEFNIFHCGFFDIRRDE